jgi:hypothetical protein
MRERHRESAYVLREIKYIFYISKLIGLFPVSFKKDPLTAEESVDITLSANITGIICSIAMICVIAGGILSAILRPRDIFCDPGDFVIKALCIPAIFSVALVSIIMNGTVNKQKVSKLVKNLMWINEEVVNHIGFKHEKAVKSFSCSVYAILLVVALFLCYSVSFWMKYAPLLYCGSVHVAKFLGIVTVIQFCKYVNCIKFLLEAIVKIISINMTENSTDNHTMHNENNGIPPKMEGPKMLTASQSSVYNINKSDPFKISEPLFINLISHKRTELHNIIFCRKIYSNIYDSVLLVSSMYGIPILLEYMCNCSGLIWTIYSVIMNVHQSADDLNDTSGTKNTILCIGLNLVMLGTLLYVSFTCHLATLKCIIIRDTVEKLLLLHPINKDLLQELQLFSNQMSNNRIKFTAFWFFVVDMKIFVTFMASALTYLIVLIQFK